MQSLKSYWRSPVVCIFLTTLVVLALSPSAPALAQGEIAAWGYSGDGLGTVPAPNSDFVAIAAGHLHSLGLRADGSITAWGLNSEGQCNVPAPNSDFIAIAGGWYHSLGLKSDGSIVAWGYNGDGECDVPAPNSGFVAVAAKGSHSLGLKADGSIAAWGNNYRGQCNVPAPNTGFVAVSSGVVFSVGLKSDGSIVAWGENDPDYGECDLPVPNSGFVAMVAGGYHGLGLKADGSIVAWGSNWEGQCNVPAPNTGFVAVAASSIHSMGLKSDGSIVAWGLNEHGNCIIPEPNAGFAAVAAGTFPAHSLGLRDPFIPTAQATTGAVIGDYIVSLAACGDRIVVATLDDLKTYLHDTVGLTLEHDVSTGATNYQLAICGDYAYIATGSGLKIYRVSDLSLVSDFIGGAADAVCVSGERAYVDLPGQDLVDVYDVSDPANPFFLNDMETYASTSMAVRGRYLYVASGHWGLRVIDTVTHAEVGQLYGSYDANRTTYSVAVCGGFAYVGYRDDPGYNNKLLIVDVSIPASPSVRTTVTLTSGAYEPTQVAVQGNWVFVSQAGHKFSAIDVTNPDAPVAAVQPTASFAGLGSIDVAGDRLYAGDGYQLRAFAGTGLHNRVASPAIARNTWTQIGIPVNLLAGVDGNPATLFSEDVPAAYGDPRWIVSRYDEVADAYERFGDPQEPPLMKPGLGYWFIQSVADQVVLDVDSTQYDQATSAEVALAAEFPAGVGGDPAQIMFANPFNRGYNPADMTFTGSKLGWTAPGLVAEGLNAYVYTWDQGLEDYVYTDYRASTLTPWQGFWLVRTAGTGAIDVNFPVVGPGKSSRDKVSEESWHLDLCARTADGNHYDLQNSLGGREGSLTGYDRWDAFEFTPPKSEFVRLYFPQGGQRFAADNRELAVTTPRQYDLTVWTYHLPGAEIVLTWPNLAQVPAELQFTLLDGTGQPLLDMREVDHYTLTAPDVASGTVPLSVRVENTAIAVEPVPAAGSARIVAVSPNPFNPATVVSFEVPARCEVEIAVYDVTGRRVDVVVQGEYAAGRHDVRWNAARQAAGTYFVRLTAGGEVSTKKVTLVK